MKTRFTSIFLHATSLMRHAKVAPPSVPKGRLVLTLLLLLTATLSWADDSGSCGTNVTYTYSEPTHTLTISGTGAMADYAAANDMPWSSYKADITTLQIGAGVSTIGNNSFNGCTGITSVVIPYEVTSIGNDAFNGCNNLDKVYVLRYTTPLTTLGNDAFSNCSSSLAIYVPTTDYSSATNWSTYASIIKIGGICGASGDNVTWLFADKDGNGSLETITISGTGAMADYSDSSSPWDPNWQTITSVVIEDGVTSIGERAFRWLTQVTAVSFGSNLTTIGNSAFELCNGLTSVTIPASVTSIGTNAFNNCSKLESITVDASNANYASEDGVLLNKAKETLIQYPGGKSGSYTIPASVTTIVDNAFYKCSIASVTIPANVTSIGQNAFYQCTNLSSVTFEANSQLETIGDDAFYKCSIASVTIPANVTSIGQNAFYQCTNLSSVTFEANSQLKTIDDDAFYGCNNAGFTSIDIPASVTYIGWRTFYCCSNLTTITLNSNPCIFKDAGFPSGANVTMNLTATVGANGEYWMTFYTSHNNYQVPATGTQIFKAELSDDKLTIRELTTDKIVTEGKAVILKSITPSITLTRTSTASSNDFDTNNSLSGVFKAEGKEVTENPSTIYALNSGAQDVGFYKVPTGNTIGVGNAYVTSTSTSDFLPLVASGNCGTTDHESDVTWLYDINTHTLTISGTGAMADYAAANAMPWFNDKSSITSVVINDGVTTIGKQAFYNHNNLASVSIAASVESIGESAFDNSSALGTVTFVGTSQLKTIGTRAFYSNAMTSIALPASLETISELAFANCNNAGFTSITIPASVTSIGVGAFQECTNLATVTLNSNPVIGTGAFDNIKAGATVTMNLTANDVESEKWTTFYNDFGNFEADANTTVYKGTVSGNYVNLTEVTDKIVNAATAVVLKSTDNPVMTLTATNSSDSNGNNLRGVNTRTATADIKATLGDGTFYVLGNKNSHFGFHKYTGANMPANKAFLLINGSGAALAPSLDIVWNTNNPAGISEIAKSQEPKANGQYFDLQGRRVTNPTKGLYIVNGKKVIVK